MADNYITIADERGAINISEDVIAVMAAASVSEVEGVATLAGQDITGVVGKKGFGRGVKVTFEDNTIVIDAIIMVRYGSSVTEVAGKVQAAISNAVTSMTGMAAPVVNVRVNGIVFDKADRA